jgi:transposase InsO family protein
MVAFIDQHRATCGVEPICAQVPIAPSTYYEVKVRERDVACQPAQAQRDAVLGPMIEQAWTASTRCYGARKVWKDLQGAGLTVARCTVERLMRSMALHGVVRGHRVRSTRPALLAPRPDDLVQRDFAATRPNQLWVADVTYVATWRRFVYVAFVTDAFSRRIVSWRATTSLCTDLALDALEQAHYERELDGPLVHHSVGRPSGRCV